MTSFPPTHFRQPNLFTSANVQHLYKQEPRIVRLQILPCLQSIKTVLSPTRETMSVSRSRHSSGKDNKSKSREREVREEEDDVLLMEHETVNLISWRPRRPIPDWIEVVPFYRIARVVHLDKVEDIYRSGRMEPRPITHFSAFHPKGLPEDHPCKNLRVLWFSPQEEDPNANSKYGNFEFSLDIHWVLNRWKRVYYIENVSYPTVTLYRVLLTNTDYGELFDNYALTATIEGPRLLPLSNDHPCNPWAKKGRPHTVRKNCPRYMGESFNKNGLILEFLIEATDEDAREIVRCSWRKPRDHLPSGDEGDGWWCHTYERRNQECEFKMGHHEVERQIEKMEQTIQQHWGDLEAVEPACAELLVGQDEAAAGTQSSTSSTGRKRQKDVESEILQALGKRVAEFGSILKDFTKAQQQPMIARAAFANYVRDSLMTMPKASYKKARSSINRLLSELMEDSDNEDLPAATAPAPGPAPVLAPAQ
ncbi:uncharacterized protein LOC143032763 [Oratosquilla oratoria]|uniref:uncharacterized protein LOC143032763 n=1 Tax=Oratosquilla oratoria TaxID=337810 RepID=UPI003F767D2F